MQGPLDPALTLSWLASRQPVISCRSKVFICCPPCVRMIELAVDLPRNHYYYDVEIRVDCRLAVVLSLYKRKVDDAQQHSLE